MLSLGETTPDTVPPPSRAGAVLLSFAIHVLGLLILVMVPERLPASLRAILLARPARAAALSGEAAAPAPLPEPARPAPTPDTLKQPSIPLKFAYVKIPNDTASTTNPSAPLFSDRDRKARQEVPTPPDAERFSIDPHSEGDSIDRVRPDPLRPEGPESPDRPSTPRGGGPGGPEQGTAPSVAKRDETATGGGKETSGTAGRSPVGEGGLLAAPRRPAGEAGSAPRAGGGPDEGEGSSSDQDLVKTLEDLRAGEYKFTFRNPAYLRDGSYGTLSFDTQGFPWGDYARRIYVAIRNNWFTRIPLAAREGIRGWVCWHFVIEKDGRVSETDLVRPSSIPPFDRAAQDAINAASPLPPLPYDFPGPREGVTYCFFYNMGPGEED